LIFGFLRKFTFGKQTHPTFVCTNAAVCQLPDKTLNWLQPAGKKTVGAAKNDRLPPVLEGSLQEEQCIKVLIA